MKTLAEKHCILKVVTGSYLYGTNIETSDKDYIGIFIAPEEYYYGLNTVDEVDASIVSKNEDGKNNEDAVDCKYYELRKFVKLAMENNPNILEILFVNQENIVHSNKYGDFLLSHKNLFPWSGCAQKFLGYAFAQKHKMKTKVENIDDIENAIKYFKDLTKSENISYYKDEIRRQYWCRNTNTSHFKVGDISLQWNGTVGSELRKLEDRASKFSHRTELITKHGYDTKFGMHLVRLMMEGKELLETGKLEFPLEHRSILHLIRNGHFSCDSIIQYSEQLEKEIEQLKENTFLRNKPAFAAINKLLIHMTKEYHQFN